MISKDIIINNDGTITIVDKRIFSEVVKAQIDGFKRAATKEILDKCPEHKQRNAALGILTEEENIYIKNTISHVIEKYDNLKQQVNCIQWNGTEQTRSNACDEVQNIHWYWD